MKIIRWPSETPLFILTCLVSFFIWFWLVVSVVGLVYVVFFGIIFFFTHMAMIAHIRGSGVRLGPQQFPELYSRVESLCHEFDFDKIPEAYLLQHGGVLNAFATKFLRSNMIVLYSDLLEACGSNTAARDMIIAHELGHIHAGHLKWHLLLMPGRFIPFLGTALSRAREYTCDRYGLAGAGNKDDAMRGLTILAAGAKNGPLVNLEAFSQQKALLNTGCMTLGEWLSTHPPLSKRILALDKTFTAPSQTMGVVRALLILSLACLIPVALTFLALLAPLQMEAVKQILQK